MRGGVSENSSSITNTILLLWRVLAPTNFYSSRDYVFFFLVRGPIWFVFLGLNNIANRPPPPVLTNDILSIKRYEYRGLFYIPIVLGKLLDNIIVIIKYFILFYFFFFDYWVQ